MLENILKNTIAFFCSNRRNKENTPPSARGRNYCPLEDY
jgi:hypothetical protein